MNVYEAIMKAADHVERNPGLWDYSNVCVPDCGTPGCALGWIGAYLGIKAEAPITRAREALKLNRSPEFYRRLDALVDTTRWRSDPALAAKALRLYAEQYHSDQKPKDRGIPADILAIFDATEAA